MKERLLCTKGFCRGGDWNWCYYYCCKSIDRGIENPSLFSPLSFYFSALFTKDVFLQLPSAGCEFSFRAEFLNDEFYSYCSCCCYWS